MAVMGAYLTRREAATYLRVSIATIDRLPIPCVHVGRRVLIAQEDLGAYIASNRSIVQKPRAPVGKPKRKNGGATWRDQKLKKITAAEIATAE